MPNNNGTLSPNINQIYDPDLRVVELIDVECGEWRPNAVRSMFPSEVSEKILNFPISIALPPGRLFWWPSKSGVYYVKSG